jgi:SAM-dependent methyltransferase
MWNDIVELRDFYERSLGQVAQRLIRQRLRGLWPNVAGQNVLGLGYATPFLRPFIDEAERVIAIMPAAQGVLRWPGPHRADGGRNRVALADETAQPLPDRSMDRVQVVHALECTEQMRPMLREIWRVLADGGRLIVIAPNRTGLWAQFERSPFATGHTYSAGQLSRLLRNTMFTPMQEARALYVPPVHSRMVLRAAPAIERLGQRWLPRLAGVVVVEAAKQLYAATGVIPAEPIPARAKLRVVGPSAARDAAPSRPDQD